MYSLHKRTLDHVGLSDALIVGFAQIGALIPGVSRSGSTLTAALFLDLERAEAARFSFLLGIPAIAAAGLKEIWELHKAHLGIHGWSVLIFGLRHRLDLGFRRDLGADAHPRAVFRVALCDLSSASGRVFARRRLYGLSAELTPLIRE